MTAFMFQLDLYDYFLVFFYLPISVCGDKDIILILMSLQNNTLITGGEGRDIAAWDIQSGKNAYSIKNAHSARVKGVAVIPSSGSGDLLASVATDGMIRVWDTRMVSGETAAMHLAEANTKSRLTCLAASSIK